MNRTLNPGTRQWDIVVLVARRSPITLTEVADEIGLARTSTQQQISRLISEGWLDRTTRSGKPGRPLDVFSLSDQSRRLFAHRTGGLARDLLDEIVETEGKSKVRSLVKGIGRKMMRKFRASVVGSTPKERLQRLSELLSENGAINDVTRSERGLALTIHTCPYHGLSSEHGAFCDVEREMVSQIVGVKARAVRRIANGHTRCEFELTTTSPGSAKR